MDKNVRPTARQMYNRMIVTIQGKKMHKKIMQQQGHFPPK